MNNKRFYIGLVQMDCRVGDKKLNIEKAVSLLDQLSDRVEIACLPEFFNTGYSLDLVGDEFYTLAEPVPGPTTRELGNWAKEKKTAVLGNIPETDSGQDGVLYDTTFIIDREGNLRDRYRKTHLYPDEHRYFRSGSEIPVTDLGFSRVGTATCFDHAFPEIFSTLAVKGAQVIFVPSAVPAGYEYLLNLRTRARAQDNQVWVAAVNRTGREGETQYCGLSKVVNPRGDVVMEASVDKEEILECEIDLDLINRERKQEPVLRSRRPDLYR